MHLSILPDHQKIKKKKFYWESGVVKNVFWCICAYFQTTRNFFSKEIFFTVWSGYKRVLMHFRILSDHEKLFFQKRYFLLSGVVKNVFLCICTYFKTTRNFFQKRYFWPSGVVKNMFWCIFAYLQTTRNFFSKKIFLTVWSG